MTQKKYNVSGELLKIPRVTYNESKYTKEDLDEIFDKLLRYEANYSPELLEIRKEQILNHSQCYFIVKVLKELSNLIGQSQNQCNETKMNYLQEELIELHSPVIFNVPINLEPFHKWETWTFGELLDKYTCLALSKGWEDYYTLPKDFSKNKRVTKWGLEDFDIDYDSIKNYHILDMLNDLVINDYIICGYDLRSFINPDEYNLLDTFNQDSLIDVKTKEKYTLEEIKKLKF